MDSAHRRCDGESGHWDGLLDFRSRHRDSISRGPPKASHRRQHEEKAAEDAAAYSPASLAVVPPCTTARGKVDLNCNFTPYALQALLFPMIVDTALY